MKRTHKFADPYMQQVSVDRVAHTIETLSPWTGTQVADHQFLAFVVTSSPSLSQCSFAIFEILSEVQTTSNLLLLPDVTVFKPDFDVNAGSAC